LAFPQTPLGVEVDLWINNAWVDITSDVYTSDKITITRGRADEGARVDPGKCTLTLNNRSGKYSPRNPLSPYYGLIGRNTPLRVAVKAGTPFLELQGNGDYASTPDVTQLDITGDIDIRIDALLTNWLNASDVLKTTILAGKLGGPTSNKSWFLGVRSNKLYFEWSADGTNVIGASSTVQPVIPANGRLSVRVTLDVDNGASGRTITFYTASSGTSGPWTQLGNPVVQSGVTSIFNSTAAVQVGAVPISMTFASGRIHALEIRNGIGGSVVANPNFTAQALGAASFTDGAGRTWTVNSPAAISNRRIRFIGEVSSWPSRWDVSGRDVRVPIEAAGILRRLGQGNKALDSTLRRRIPSYKPLAYWPMEDGESATQATSPIPKVTPLRLSPANWAATDSLASSRPLPTINSGTSTPCQMYGRVPAPSSTLTKWGVQWMYRLDQPNATTRTFMRILCATGTVAEWLIQFGSGGTTVFGLGSDGSTVFSQGIATGSELYGQWVKVEFNAVQNGSNVNWHIGWVMLTGVATAFDGVFAGTVGRPTAVASPPGGYSSDLDGMTIGHISVWSVDDTPAYDNAITAWAGETAGGRLTRLASEEGVPLARWGDATAQEQVGPQRPDALLALLEEAADADGGILYERRDATSLAYRDRISLYNQPVALALDYNVSGHVAPPLEPVDDDQKVRNDVTVTRSGGAWGRAVLDEGPLSTQAPPNGVGVYDESVTLNLYNDAQPEQHAGWRLHLGTVDEARYPVLNLNMAAAPSLIDTVTLVESGDRLQVANPPAWLPPGPIDLLMQGYQETIGHPVDWDFQLNCTPASPWTVAVVDDDVLGRVDTDGSKLAVGVSSTATTLSVAVTDGPLWITTAAYPTEFPFDIEVGGERMRVTGITGASSPQTFTVVRSVNGVVKAQTANTDVSLADPAIVAL
jgi:hypothetical protein